MTVSADAMNHDAMDRMLAIVVSEPGGIDALQPRELPLPAPGAGQVRVRAVSIGVGRPDALMRTGRYKWMPPLPLIPGNELAGVVDAVGAGVSDIQVGQRVLLSARELPVRGGCYATHALAPADALYPLPEAVDFDAAVSLPNFQLAHALLLGCGSAAEVRSVLLTAAAGGVACAVAQTARSRGMSVIATASSQAKREFALSQGAHHALDSGDAQLPERVRELTGGAGVDLALDPVGGELFMACLRSLAPLGMAVSYNVMGGMPAGDVFAELRRQLGSSLAVRTFSMHTFDADPARRRALMASAIADMAAGRVRPPPATVLPLAQARQAHALLDDPASTGKIILKP